MPLAPVSAQPPAPQPPRTRPLEGLREYNPRVFAIVGGRVVASPGKTIEKAHVIVRDGVIAAVGPDVAIPADAQVVDATGRSIYAGFIDGYTEQSSPDDPPSSAAHWSPHITPQLRMADHWKMEAAAAEKARAQGFTAQLIAPIGGIFKGSSVLVATDDGERDQAVLRPVAAHHLRLTVSRGGRRGGFPNSPMGAVALARQSLLDAAWHAEAWKAHQTGTLPAAPERNDALAALHDIVTQNQLIVVDTSDEQFALRADQFAREFHLRIALRGSGREYRQLDAIKALERTLILPVDFPKPPNVATAESAANVAIEDLMHWDIAPENPGRLEKAGVRFALTTSGQKEPRDFWPATRKAVKRGLSSDTALAALTTIPAELFGAAEHTGTVEPGKWANLAIATGDLFTDSEARIAETWVRGKRFELKRPPVVDVAGSWKTTLSNPPPKAGDARDFTLELRRKNDELSGDIVLPAPAPAPAPAAAPASAAAPAKKPVDDTAKGEKADAEARKEDSAPKKDSGDKKQPSDNDKKEAADKKPVDKKPIDKKPVDKKPGDKKPVDKKPVDKKPVDKKSTGNADGGKKPVDKKPVGNKDGVKPTGDKTASVKKPDPKKTDVRKEDAKQDEPKKTDASADAKQPEAVRVSLQQLTLRDARLVALFDAGKWGFEGKAQLTVVVMRNDASAPAADGSTAPPARIAGDIVWPDGSTSRLAAILPPPVPAAPAKTTTAAELKDSEKDSTKDSEKDGAKDSVKDASKEPSKDAAKGDAAKASFPIVYPLGAFGREKQPERPSTVLFKNATIWTCGPAGVLHDASVLVRDGRIEAVGATVAAPPGAVVIDCRGRHLSPGLIDCHSHMATDGGINESTQSVTAEVRIGDFIDATDVNIYRQLAGGVTSSHILHGSANTIGGQCQAIKLRWGALPEALKFAEAPPTIKFALGENVKQSNWERNSGRYPQSRMGVDEVMRDSFQAARHYQADWARWKSAPQGAPPRRDLELDALVEVLEQKRWVHCHSYRQDEILALLRTLEGFEVRVQTLQHILEGYKVADALRKHGAMGSSFADWWAYKFEVIDAIPHNGALMHNAGVVVSFNSDDRELARHLNHEAAKAVKYGGVPPVEALKFVTLNPAKQLRVEHLVGSLEAGKQADIVVWSGDPLSVMSRCEQTWVDGRKYFDREEDLGMRKRAATIRATLVQKILASGESMREPGESYVLERDLWPRFDEFCNASGKSER